MIGVEFNPECGCPEMHTEIGMATVTLHLESNGKGEAFIDFGDWQEEKSFECSTMPELVSKAEAYIYSLPME